VRQVKSAMKYLYSTRRTYRDRGVGEPPCSQWRLYRSAYARSSSTASGHWIAMSPWTALVSEQ
jgi:hypothetical protein